MYIHIILYIGFVIENNNILIQLEVYFLFYFLLI